MNSVCSCVKYARNPRFDFHSEIKILFYVFVDTVRFVEFDAICEQHTYNIISVLPKWIRDAHVARIHFGKTYWTLCVLVLNTNEPHVLDFQSEIKMCIYMCSWTKLVLLNSMWFSNKNKHTIHCILPKWIRDARVARVLFGRIQWILCVLVLNFNETNVSDVHSEIKILF